MTSDAPVAPLVVPVILAAGASRRMGRPKALLDYGGRSALAHLVATYAKTACTTPCVVIGHDRSAVEAEARRLGAVIVVNPDPSRGQISSVREALRVLPPPTEAFAVHPVDAPLVTAATITALLDALREAIARERRDERGASILIPVYEGRRGHPGLFRRSIVPEVEEGVADDTMRDVLHRDGSRVDEIVVGDPHVLDRIDTPEAHAAAVASLRGPGASGPAARN